MIKNRCNKCNAELNDPVSFIFKQRSCGDCGETYIVMSGKKEWAMIGGAVAAIVLILGILLGVAFSLGRASKDENESYAAVRNPNTYDTYAPRDSAGYTNSYQSKKQAIYRVMEKLRGIFGTLQAIQQNSDFMASIECIQKLPIALRQIDTRGCPASFVKAFDEFIEATNLLAQLVSFESLQKFVARGDAGTQELKTLLGLHLLFIYGKAATLSKQAKSYGIYPENLYIRRIYYEEDEDYDDCSRVGRNRDVRIVCRKHVKPKNCNMQLPSLYSP